MTRPFDSQQQKRKTCRIVDLAVPTDHWLELKESKKRDNTYILQKNWKKRNMNLIVIQIVIGVLGTLNKETEGLGNKKTSGEHPHCSIVDIGQNTKKNPGELKSLVFTQSPEENHQLTLVWKILRRVK